MIFPGSHEWQEDPGEVVPVPLVDPALKDIITSFNVKVEDRARLPIAVLAEPQDSRSAAEFIERGS